MTRIILTRHGHVEGIVPPTFRGRQDLPLTDKGKEEARRLTEALMLREAPDAIYTSPLSRCVETAGIVSGRLGIDSQTHQDLLDIDYGEWTGQAHEEVQQHDPNGFELWLSAPQLARPLGGESLYELCGRVGDALRDILDRHEGSSVLLVCHDSTARAAILTLMDLPLSYYPRIPLSPCGISELEVQLPDVFLHSLNETGHLAELGHRASPRQKHRNEKRG